jgi:BirA family biotin operon repressor/biotin-[acetyl-CoA-carboxylase] ligase
MILPAKHKKYPDKLTIMLTEHALLELLSDGYFHSGTELGEKLKISRAAIWKQIRQLEILLGLDVQAVQGRGYRLAHPIELLEEKVIYDALSRQSKALLGMLEVHLQLDSTNRYLMQHGIRDNKSGAHVVLAEMQTAGRGRRGKHWVSPFAQNIYLSLMWQFTDATLNLSGVSLATGVAVIRALNSLGISGLQLKWPNDIYCQGKKLAGILLELRGEAGGRCNMVVGLGLNVNMSAHDAAEIDQAWTDIRSVTQRGFSRNQLVSAILSELLPCMALYSQQGLTPFLKDWEQHDMLKDKPVTLLMHEHQREGVAHGVNEQGALLFEYEGKIEPLYAGELSLRLNQ